YNLKIDYSNDILPIVSGKVFHVTPTSNMPSIKETGALIPNSHLLYHSEFGNTVNGFFRLKGCVSFFDYRCINTPHWEQHAYKCFPTQILNHNDSISILFLNENEYDKLIPWTIWKKEKAWSERVVPWVETGYKGNVPLINITQEIIVEYNISLNQE
ncbi:hypothetical protein Q4893_004866, partial [Salmonella enterica subsp. enterica serovar Alachua]|nr:hypothetical protein [Salmonella enterica]EKB7465891.1 hypothetical protein [Salmonella enterica subsp. enterica serovar Alachua]EBD8181433.1 hypothetical protein [Salmonella enterica]ECC3823628.1 hypothetical protein [Salmonella enterica]ECY7057547.1 hypothetical protein [Salmonella enterica]